MNIIGSVLESLKTLKVTLTIIPFAGKTKRELNSRFGNWKRILLHTIGSDINALKFENFNIKGWWRSWLARRSHSLKSYPEVESSSLSHPKNIFFFLSETPNKDQTFLNLKPEI